MSRKSIQPETNISVDTGQRDHDISPERTPTVGKEITTVHPGDLVFFTRKRIHCLIRAANDYTDDATNASEQPSHVDLVWVDGYDRAFRTRSIRRDILDGMAKENRLRLIDESVTSVNDLGRAPGVRDPHRYNRDTTLQPAPRLPVSNMSFERTYSLNLVNGFLKHPVVDHKQGRVQKAKGMFVARRPDGRIAAVITVNSVNARQAFDRHTVEITRYASHPESKGTRTNNTATWMISRVCQWAALEGYERIRTLAGTDANEGQIYKASNFEFDGFANSSGAYNRDGRKNHSHAQRLRRYIREVNIDGEKAVSTFPRRFESRLDADDEGKGKATTLTSFGKPSREKSPATFRFTREEVSDYKFTNGEDADQYPAFSERLKTLVNDTNTPITLSELTNSRRQNIPAAAFGASVGDDLVAALLITGDPNSRVPIARVEGYAAESTKYPDATARWLLSRARDWSELNPYESIVVPDNTFAHIDNVNESVPAGVSFTRDQNGCFHHPVSSTASQSPEPLQNQTATILSE